MKGKFKRLVVISMIITILSMQLPTIILATEIVRSPRNMQEKVFKTDNLDNKNKLEYEEGKAIILYKNSSVSKKNKKSSIFNEIKIDDTVSFEDVSQVSAYSSSSKDVDLKVSLVSSDRYSTQELVKKLNNQKEIIYAEPNYKVKATSLTNDEYLKYQWAIENIGQNGGIEGEDIKTKETTSDKEKVIAIIDTGVDYTNSELKDHMWNNPHDKKKLAGQYGYDFVNGDNDPIDDAGHGTHCAGIMTAESDNEGITGSIINNNNIKIMALKFLDDAGSGSTYSAISAYNYIYKAQELGTNVVAINNSWGGYASEEDIILKEIIGLVGENGALSICASGNENTNTDKVVNIPSGIDSDYIISVAAANEKGELATFSNYGKETVDIAAPGADILSTVSYNVFNPSIYSTEVKGNLCSKYENFESGLGSLASNYKVTQGNVEINSNNYFGEKGGKALEWSIKNAKAGKKYSLAIKIDETKSSQIWSSMIKVTSTGEPVEDFFTGNACASWTFNTYGQDYNSIDLSKINIMTDDYEGFISHVSGMDNYWDHVTEELKYDKGTLVIQVYPHSDGDITFTIDDYAISKDTAKEEEFGKYEFYNGTSMATPYVTSAVAIASNLYETEEALTLKNRVLNSSREVKELSDKVSTSGVLDIEKFSEPRPIITSAVINKNGDITVTGEFFGDNPKLYVNNKEVSVKYNKDEKVLVFNDSTLKNKNLEFKIDTGKYEYSKMIYLALGKEFNNTDYEFNQFLPAISMVSDKTDLYILQSDLMMNVISEYGIQNVEIDKYSLFENYGEVEKYTTKIENDTGLIYNNGEIYTVFSLNYGYTINKVLAQYDKENCTWIKVTDIPSEYNTLCPTIASYNSEIYLIGGYDKENKKITTNVYKYDMDKDKWIESIEIPEGRVASKAIQVGNKLVVLMGGNETGTMPEPLIFNGTTWKKSQTKIEVLEKKHKLTYIPSDDEEMVINNEDKDIPEIYSAGIGVVSNGVIITGLKTDGLGDTFIYNVEKDSYEESGYVLSETGYTTATTNGDTLYAMSTSLYDIFNRFGIKSTEVKGEALIPFELVIDGAGIEIPDGRGDLLLSGKYEYNHGTTINIKPEIVDYRYYIKSITVNGKAVSGTSYKLVLSEPTKIVIKTQKYPNISGLKMTSQTTSSVKISWNKLNGAEGYQVYLYNTKTKKYQKYKYINSNSLTISKLSSSLTYKIKVDAIKKINGANRVISTATLAIGTKTLTPNISSIKSAKKAATVKWKKISGASGYEIYMSTSKNGKYTRKRTITNGKTISSKLTGLKSKKNYYFKIRTYKTVAGKKIYSSFSKVKSVKIK